MIVLTFFSAPRGPTGDAPELYWLIVFAFVVGAVGLFAGVGAVMVITLGARRGWPQTIPGILLSTVDFLFGLVGLTLAIGLF